MFTLNALIFSEKSSPVTCDLIGVSSRLGTFYPDYEGKSWKQGKSLKPCVTALTGVKGDFADHNPPRGEAEFQLDVLADPVVQLDRDVSRVLEDSVLHVIVHYRIAREVFATDAKRDADLRKYLKHKK